MYKTLKITGLLLLLSTLAFAQPDRWQQKAEYFMDIDFDVNTHQFTGKQKIVYYNNSPDELQNVFYHLFFNAFQPESMMDMRNRTLADADQRVGGRISKLKANEMGYHKVTSLKQNGKEVDYKIVGTILEVKLRKPIKPNSKTTFEMTFESQVPIQIRRSGRDSKEGISYSMSQWYPKMCEYDYQGWHAHPYVGREFYGIWGDFDVKINIDKDYIVGATGYLQNKKQIGHGYSKGDSKVIAAGRDKLKYHFKAPNVHDFVWAADPDYTHDITKAESGVEMHFFYQKNEKTLDTWSRLPGVMDKAFTFINKRFGKYPYDKYSFIQGGDGGMEYPMATLITGERPFSSLVGVSVHELMHSWYQMILGTNEALHPWMDEGFTSYATDEVMNYLKAEGLLPGLEPVEFPQAGSFSTYASFSSSGYEEPLSTHSDHFMTNGAYGVASYVKGNVFLPQLSYIIGKSTFDKGMLTYFDTWKFKHPNPNDFIRVMEKESGLELDWYKEYFVNTTHTIDYAVVDVQKKSKKETIITLQKIGVMPMPIDVVVYMKNGDKKLYNIPLRIMRGEKSREDKNMSFKVLEDWPWTNNNYEFVIKEKMKKIEKVVIDPSGRLADVEKDNNVFMLNN